MPDSSADRDPLDRLAEEFVARFRAGERPALTDYVARLPERADDIRDLFPALVEMEQLKPVSADRTGDFIPPPEPALLTRVGDFRILRSIGRGGMGVVYEAVQESLGRHVALKLLPSEALADPQRLERFRREAKAAARLHHTNIVPVFGTGEADGRHYFAMQFIDGHPLDAVIAEVRRLKDKSVPVEPGCAASGVAEALLTGVFVPAAPQTDPPVGPNPAPVATSPVLSGNLSDGGGHYWQEVARLGAQAGDALSYAHGQGILHRDIKPANLLLDPRGTLWITDFGLAKTTDADDLTHAGDVVGTLRYLAPERFEGKGDERADIYALGLTLYEMLTLQPAFTAHNRAQLVEQVLAANPPRPRMLSPTVPRDLETIVLKAIARDPVLRYQSAADLADDLRRFLQDRPIRARRASSAEQAWRWCRRNPAVASLLTLVLLVFALGGGAASWFAFRAQAERGRAERERERAESRESEANGERNRANEVAQRVKAAQERTSRLLYVSQINLAAAALADEDIPRLQQLLDETTPKPGEADLRGWEWHYLKNLTRVPVRQEYSIQGEEPLLSSDGRWLTVLKHVGENCAFDVWDVRGRQRVATLPRPGAPSIPWVPDAIAQAQVTPDGSVLAVTLGEIGSEQASLHLWRLDTGEKLSGPKELPLDFRYMNPFVLGPGAVWVAWEELPPRQSRIPLGSVPSEPAGSEKTVARWERSTGGINRKHFRSHCGSGGNVEFSADGETVYCGANTYSHNAMANSKAPYREQRLEAWDLTADPPRLRWPAVSLPRLQSTANSCVFTQFSPGRTCLAVLNHRKDLTVYRLSEGKPLWHATALDWSPGTSATLLGVSDDGSRVLLRSSAYIVLERSGNEEDAPIRRSCFRHRFPDDLASGLRGFLNSTWTSDGRTFVHLERRDDTNWVVREMDVSRDLDLVQSPPTREVSIESQEEWNSMGGKSLILRDSRGVEIGRVEAPEGGTIHTAALADKNRRLLVSMHLARPTDSGKLGNGGWDGNYWTLYELVPSGGVRRIAEGKGMAISGSSTPWFAVASMPMSSLETSSAFFAIHHLTTGECLRRVGGQTEPDDCTFEGFSPSGDFYAVFSSPAGKTTPTRPDGGGFRPVEVARKKVTLRLMETATGKECWAAGIAETPVGHHGYLGKVVFSPDGNRICAYLTGLGGASPVCVMRMRDGNKERMLEMIEPRSDDHILSNGTGGLIGVSRKGTLVLHGFNPDGRLVLSKEGEVQLWNLETGACEAKLRGHGHHTRWTHLSDDGARLFVYCDHRDSFCRLHVWDLSTGRQLLELPCGHPHLFGRMKWEIVENTLFIQQENGYRVFDGTPATP
jgi:serine/threonine protein kinase